MLGLDLEGPIALASQWSGQRVRFAAQAQSALVLTDASAFVATVDEVSDETRAFGYPVATVALSKKDDLGPEAAAELTRWWRISLAVDIAGAARSALWLTKTHLTDRIQFGKPIASKQAVQHRLATIYVRVEAATWLARYAASLADPAEGREAAAAAATTAVGLAHDAIWELHQLTGATGFTVEYDLQLLTMRMHALRLELGGVSGGHARDLAQLRWFGAQRSAS
jgi:alkylation response protein AidB-like acyl-CoA dehydrogenase